MPRSVNEGDAPLVPGGGRDHEGRNTLGDAARLACGDATPTERIEQRCLPVVNMAHQRDNRRTEGQLDALGGCRRRQWVLVHLLQGDFGTQLEREQLDQLPPQRALLRDEWFTQGARKPKDGLTRLAHHARKARGGAELGHLELQLGGTPLAAPPTRRMPRQPRPE
eukprot:scaffold215682_cov35-Tisochrysis_lutea.AAC.1